jgi:4-hydroxy-3-polyprenylbenzoate decarboxylase
VYETLAEFVHALEQAGELKRIRVPVSPLLEIAALSDMQAKAACPHASEHARRFDPLHCERGGKALLFESVEGSDFPVLINAYGSYRRTEMALGCAEGGFEAIASRLAAIAKPEPPKSFGDLLRKARQFLPLLRAPPRRVREGLCHEVVRVGDEVDLLRLPLIRWPSRLARPAGRAATSPSRASTPSTPTTRGPRSPRATTSGCTGSSSWTGRRS